MAAAAAVPQFDVATIQAMIAQALQAQQAQPAVAAPKANGTNGKAKTNGAPKLAAAPKPAPLPVATGSDGTVEAHEDGTIVITVTPRSWRQSKSGKSVVAVGSGPAGEVIAGAAKGQAGYFLICKGLAFRQ